MPDTTRRAEPAPQIASPRLSLSPWTAHDLAALHTLLTEPGVRRYLLDDQVVARGWVAAEIDASATRFAESGFGIWALRLKDAPSAVIGFCGFRPFFEPPETQLIYGLAQARWGQGLAAEAARAVIAHAFAILGAERVIAAADAPNTASVRVMQKAGMTFVEQTTRHGGPLIYYEARKP